MFPSKIILDETFHMKISFIHTQSLVHLHVNKTSFHMKGFALGLALKQRRKATRKSPISSPDMYFFKKYKVLLVSPDNNANTREKLNDARDVSEI